MIYLLLIISYNTNFRNQVFAKNLVSLSGTLSAGDELIERISQKPIRWTPLEVG